MFINFIQITGKSIWKTEDMLFSEILFIY